MQFDTKFIRRLFGLKLNDLIDTKRRGKVSEKRKKIN